MPAPKSQTTSAPVCPDDTITLDPIRTIGPAALDPHGLPGVAKLTLRQLQVQRDPALHEVLTISSDDLLKRPLTGADDDPIPFDGTLTAATIDFLFTNCDRPHAVYLCPPATIKLQFPADADRVLAWLRQSRFRVNALGKSALKLLLILTFALNPAPFDDDDPDDPDPYHISTTN